MACGSTAPIVQSEDRQAFDSVAESASPRLIDCDACTEDDTSADCDFCEMVAATTNPFHSLSGEEKVSFRLFFEAVTVLQEKGDRKKAQRLFSRVDQDHPETRWARQSKELAEQLAIMIQEDDAWVEPSNPNSLAGQEKIDYLIYHLRDVTCYQTGQPAGVWVLGNELGSRCEEPNAARGLSELGEEVVPHLIKHLDDRRPLRSVAFHRDFKPSRTVLRYQDAAEHVLIALAGRPFMEECKGFCYFSTATIEEQNARIARIAEWAISLPDDVE